MKELLEIYRLLESASECDVDEAACRAIERAVSCLQVLDSDHVVVQTRELARSFEGLHTESIAIENLMQTLRENVRHYLGLSVREERTMHLRLSCSPPLPRGRWVGVQRDHG